MNPFVKIAVTAARRAGRIILRHIDRLESVAVEQKGARDFVSAVDKMAEEEIIGVINARHPSHHIIAEEHGGQLLDDAAALDAEQVEWIIDPLDGTANYLHRHPQFAVSIAVRNRGQLQHAVVFDPLRDELYIASRGQGAQLNDRRIHVARQTQLPRAALATNFAPQQFEHRLQQFSQLAAQVGAVRISGSTALDLAYLACGRIDGYWQRGLSVWDIAAGGLLVREAGGLVTDFDGAQLFLQKGEIIAANPLLFNELLKRCAPSTQHRAAAAKSSVKLSSQPSTKLASKLSSEPAIKLSSESSTKPSIKYSTKPPVKSSVKSPSNLSSKSPAKSWSKSSTKSSSKSPADSSAKSSSKSWSKSSAKPSVKSSAKSSSNPSTKSSSKSWSKSSTKPSSKSPAKSWSKSSSKSPADSSAKPSVKPSAKSATKYSSKSSTKPSTKFSPKSSAKPSTKPSTKFASKSSAKSAAKPSTKFSPKSAAKPSSKSRSKSSTKSPSKSPSKSSSSKPSSK